MDEVCTHCDDAALGSCARCDGPVCDAHTPLAFQRCVRCERDYQRRARRGFVRQAAIGGIVSLVAGLVIMQTLQVLDLGQVFENETRRVYVHIFGIMFGAMFAALGVTEWLRRRARRRFLGELHVSLPRARTFES